ncbi:MAG TPA: hypothetical protein VM123_06360 [archaeon]|nr:hypothetical protein [archaeon]
MKKIERNLAESQKAYLDLQRAMVNLEASKYVVNFSDDVHDKLSTIRLIFDYIFTKYGNYDFRRDCIIDFKISEIENILEALESFIDSYGSLIKTYRDKPSSKNIRQSKPA